MKQTDWKPHFQYELLKIQHPKDDHIFFWRATLIENGREYEHDDFATKEQAHYWAQDSIYHDKANAYHQYWMREQAREIVRGINPEIPPLDVDIKFIKFVPDQIPTRAIVMARYKNPCDKRKWVSAASFAVDWVHSFKKTIYPMMLREEKLEELGIF